MHAIVHELGQIHIYCNLGTSFKHKPIQDGTLFTTVLASLVATPRLAT
jgi:hypothetical protein